MRGSDERSGALFSYVDLEARVPADHPLRTIRMVVNEALRGLSPGFRDLYARIGRPSIPPSVAPRDPSAGVLFDPLGAPAHERLDFDLLFRWFVGLGIDDAVWNHSTFSENRDRLLSGDVAAEFLAQVLDQPQVRRLLSGEHFSVDGSLVEAWASMKSSERRTIRATRRRAARLARLPRRTARQRRPRLNDRRGSTQRPGPGSQALLRRSCADGEPARSGGRCRAHPGLRPRRTARGAGHAGPAADRQSDHARRDRGFDARDFVMELRERRVTPHIAQNTSGRRSAIDGRTTRHPGYGAVAGQKAHRGSLRLDQDHRRSVQDQAARSGAGALGVHPRGRRLQPGAAAAFARRERLMAKAPLLAKAFDGRWRIVEIEAWPDDYLDLIEPATSPLKEAWTASSCSAPSRAGSTSLWLARRRRMRGVLMGRPQ